MSSHYWQQHFFHVCILTGGLVNQTGVDPYEPVQKQQAELLNCDANTEQVLLSRDVTSKAKCFKILNEWWNSVQMIWLISVIGLHTWYTIVHDGLISQKREFLYRLNDLFERGLWNRLQLCVWNVVNVVNPIGHRCYIHWPIVTYLGQDDHRVCPHMT